VLLYRLFLDHQTTNAADLYGPSKPPEDPS
jgi:hypothetical protein